MKNFGKITELLTFLLLGLTIGCKEYLGAIPDKKLVVPSSLQDLQALLDENAIINNFPMGLGEASADNYYLTYNDWSTFSEGDKNIYIWEKELFFNSTDNDWFLLYRPVYYANIVLENLNNIKKQVNDKMEWNNLKGSALFIRARSFYILAATFCKAYDSLSSDSDLGIPIRQGTDFNVKSSRSNVGDSYQRIINDLKAAVQLLPVTPIHVMRPSKPAAYALLARVYLSMRKYKEAYLYADSCLQLNNALMDYNSDAINNTGTGAPFDRFNPEVIYSASGGVIQLTNANAKVDSNLYNSYDVDDLRKTLFFKENPDGTHAFVGNYFDQYSHFYGLATDEMYLTRSECEARLGDIKSALRDLNSLLLKRWKKDTYSPISIGDPNKVLNLILRERRKELLFRNIRWMDIKRLNKEGANITLQRNLNGKTYILKPNDNKFALPLPINIINLTGMLQNPR